LKVRCHELMSDDRRKRVARNFRLVQATFALVSVGAASWLFMAEGLGIWRWVLVPVLLLVGVSAVIDVFNGPFGRARK